MRPLWNSYTGLTFVTACSRQGSPWYMKALTFLWYLWGRFQLPDSFTTRKIDIPLLFWLNHSFLFWHHFSSPVTIQDRNGRCCSRANQWRASREAHMVTRWFFWFWLRACGTHTPDFLTLSIECKCRTMMEWSQFITFASSRVNWRGWV